MAFATTNVSRSAFGDKKVTFGDWTGSAGDADGSFKVEGGRVYMAVFMPNGSTTPAQWIIPTPSTSGSVTTLVVPNRSAVTAGTFMIIHA